MDGNVYLLALLIKLSYVTVVECVCHSSPILLKMRPGNVMQVLKSSILVCACFETRPVLIHQRLFMPLSHCDVSNNSINWLSSGFDCTIRRWSPVIDASVEGLAEVVVGRLNEKRKENYPNENYLLCLQRLLCGPLFQPT